MARSHAVSPPSGDEHASGGASDSSPASVPWPTATMRRTDRLGRERVRYRECSGGDAAEPEALRSGHPRSRLVLAPAVFAGLSPKAGLKSEVNYPESGSARLGTVAGSLHGVAPVNAMPARAYFSGPMTSCSTRRTISFSAAVRQTTWSRRRSWCSQASTVVTWLRNSANLGPTCGNA
jgi:hypothetical protein